MYWACTGGGGAEILAELEFLHAGRFQASQIRDLGHKRAFPERRHRHCPFDLGDEWRSWTSGHEAPGGILRGIFTHVICRSAEGWRLAASQNTDLAPIPDFLE